MKKIFVALFLSGISLIEVLGVNCVVLQNKNKVQVYQSMASAVMMAAAGDTLYVGAGLYDDGDISISKKLTIYGTGIYPDSIIATGCSDINSTITLTDGANGTMLTGLKIKGITISGTGTLSDVLISRCQINSIWSWGKLDNFTFSENALWGYWGGTTTCAGYCVFEKNIFTGAHTDVKGTSTVFSNLNGNGVCYIRNNNFLTNTGGVSICFVGLKGCFLNNNLFLSNGTDFYLSSQSENNTYRNNFCNYSRGCDFEGSPSVNYYNSSLGYNKIFIAFNNITIVPGTNSNLHISPSSGLNKAGTDGRELGIYGTAVPFKDGFMPSNPHISSVYIDPETDANGYINLRATITAQSR